MSVITGKKIIFCEGKQYSLDYILLNRLVDNIQGDPTIVPAGSKFTFSIFAQGYFYPGEAYNQRNPASKWGHGDSPGIEAISEWIENSSKAIKEYQVVRWALSDLIRMSNSYSRLKTTWTGGSGKLPTSLTHF